eukprot:GHVU01071810.1.p1 GENE.GHVU01071810.1~~GHVU01071810.1.p1  ORF type:complete len:185 (-),score=20.22 GHVU01071810.1:184-738(-)
MSDYYRRQYDNQDQQDTYLRRKPRLRVFIAGACANNGRSYSKMGSAYQIMDNRRRNILDDDCYVRDGGTNQRAVLLAYLDALNSIWTNDLLNREGVTVVEVVTRQQVVTKIFNEWRHNWKRHPKYRDEFTLSNGKLAKNGDLIADILDAQEDLGSHIQYLYFARQGTDRDEVDVADWAHNAVDR